jgi:hypothetical protein
MKKGKVVSVTPQGDYQLKDGRTLYKFALQFDNGDSGEYSSVKPDQNKFVVGQEAEYELNATQYGNRIKPVYNQGGGYSGGGYTPKGNYSSGSDDKQKMIVKQSCLKAAVDLLKDKGAKSTDVLKVADSFVTWVMEEEKKETGYDTHFSSREEKIQTAQAIVNGQAEDDLPF